MYISNMSSGQYQFIIYVLWAHRDTFTNAIIKYVLRTQNTFNTYMSKRHKCIVCYRVLCLLSEYKY